MKWQQRERHHKALAPIRTDETYIEGLKYIMSCDNIIRTHVKPNPTRIQYVKWIPS